MVLFCTNQIDDILIYDNLILQKKALGIISDSSYKEHYILIFIEYRILTAISLYSYTVFICTKLVYTGIKVQKKCSKL